MHEYSIIQSLVDSVESQLAAHPAAIVRKVRVRIGELSGVDTGLLATAYDVFRADTVCENAELEIDPIEAQWACPGCGNTIRKGELLQCATCDTPARLVSGDDIILERIELEVH